MMMMTMMMMMRRRNMMIYIIHPQFYALFLCTGGLLQGSQFM
jgi:hypothetical protein